MRRITSFLPTLTLLAATALATPAFAKLPALSDEAKAKAAETAARAAHADKVAGYQLCRSMDKTAEHYRKTSTSASKTATAPTETPACADPGAFVAPVAAPAATAAGPAAATAAAASAPPLEAAGAHSPPKTATAPPSGKATAAEQQGSAKK